MFATKPNLDSHIKKIHQNDNSKTHRCETCNNLFSSAPNLKQHIKVVHEVEVNPILVIHDFITIYLIFFRRNMSARHVINHLKLRIA